MSGSVDMKQPAFCYSAKVVSVYDGDTITVVLDLGCSISVRKKIRLKGINTPEVRGKERPEGLKARDYLRGLILDKEVVIETKKDKTGKYGRLIGTIWLEDKNVNELLVENKYAVKKEY